MVFLPYSWVVRGLGVDLRTNTIKTCVQNRLDYVLNIC